jgi:hypothetical protein
VIAYAERLDAGDLDGVADLFSHGAFRNARSNRVRTRKGEVREMYDSVVIYDDGTPRTKHVLGNLSVAIDDANSATASCTFAVLQAFEGGSIQPVLAGRYEDRFERADGEWRFAERVVDPDLVGDLRQHMGGS